MRRLVPPDRPHLYPFDRILNRLHSWAEICEALRGGGSRVQRIDARELQGYGRMETSPTERRDPQGQLVGDIQRRAAECPGRAGERFQSEYCRGGGKFPGGPSPGSSNSRAILPDDFG